MVAVLMPPSFLLKKEKKAAIRTSYILLYYKLGVSLHAFL